MSFPSPFTAHSAQHRFTWDLATDHAQLTRRDTGDLVWSGSLLPLFWLAAPGGLLRAVKANARLDRSTAADGSADIALELAGFGHGRLQVVQQEGALQFQRLEVTWTLPAPPAVSALYFGCAPLTPAQRQGVPTLDLPFWPDWRADGFAVASAKTNPMQSFFRSWDFGHANIALGSFGPAMGTPYAAAFPRPSYAACAGGRSGWLCFGAGDVPDAALTFQVRARSGAIEWRYREELWGAPPALSRTWHNPLWLTWADTAWQAYRDYFRLFPHRAPARASHQKSFWGTWGDFRLNRFDVRSSVDRACDGMEAQLICIDDPWEAEKGSCRPHPGRLPHFAADIAYAHERKLGVGIWMPTGWIENYAAEGLTTDDLLLSRDGQPVRSNWAVDPHETSQQFYCLDPATAGTRRFLRERTRRVIRDYRPTLLKIDFGYGLPGPDACTSRDPACRGERLAWSLARIVTETARELDPAITVLGYSVHPLWDAVQDQVSLDDLGDAGEHEAAGHGQWSIWAALAADRGAALMGSSGYLWPAETDVLMNSAILGAPGANLPGALPDGSPLPVVALARRRALFRWYRRTTRWEPLWLDSEPGSLQHEPQPRNWGRLETFAGERALTALALRDPSPAALAAPELHGLRWTGRWIAVAQDDASLFAAGELALIPLAAGEIALPRAAAPTEVRAVFGERDEPWAAWTWRDGVLRVGIDEAAHAQPLLGLLVRS